MSSARTSIVTWPTSHQSVVVLWKWCLNDVHRSRSSKFFCICPSAQFSGSMKSSAVLSIEIDGSNNGEGWETWLRGSFRAGLLWAVLVSLSMRCESISLDIHVRAHRYGPGVNEMIALRFPTKVARIQSTIPFFQFAQRIVVVGKLSDCLFTCKLLFASACVHDKLIRDIPLRLWPWVSCAHGQHCHIPILHSLHTLSPVIVVQKIRP